MYVDNRFKPLAVVVLSGHWCSGLARTGFHPLIVLPLCAPSFKQLAVNIAQAADCRDFVRRKHEEEVSRAAQKRKKEIAWGCVFVNLPLLSSNLVLGRVLPSLSVFACDTLESH